MIGETLGHFRILEMVGAGGMGVVYRAHDERLNRDVALKVLPPGALADDITRKRFRMEALTLSRLNHPNIATVHDFSDGEGGDFLVMELIQGRRSTRRSRGRLCPSATSCGSASSSRRGWPPPTPRGSSTATSSPATSASPPTAA